MITPFDPHGGVDRATLTRLVDRLVASGVHGLFPLGSTGEVAYLTDRQRQEVCEVVVQATAGRVPVIVGCIDLSAPRVIEQARMAQRAGADGVVATTPIYAINDATETADHFRAIRAAVDLPLIAYDVPVRSHARVPIEVVMQLAEEGVLAGIKDSSGDDIGFRRLLRANRAAGSPLALLSGHELMCDAMLMAGADGLVPGLSNVDPSGYVRLYQAAQQGDWGQAAFEQDRLADLFEIVFAASGRSADARGVGAFKAAMVVLGLLPSAAMAAPVTALDAEHLEAVRKIVVGWQARASVDSAV